MGRAEARGVGVDKKGILGDSDSMGAVFECVHPTERSVVRNHVIRRRDREMPRL